MQLWSSLWSIWIQSLHNNLSEKFSRKLCKTAALVSNLCPDASDPQLFGVLSKDDAYQESQCYSATHHPLASLIWKIHRMIIKHLQNKNLKGSLFCGFLLAHRKKIMNTQFGWSGGAVFTGCSCSCPTHGILQFSGYHQTQQGIIETADLRLCTRKFS